MQKVVINTSPLIVLFKSQLSDLLPQLFTEIIVPGAVWDEIVEAGKTDAASRQLPTVSWAQRVNLTTVSPVITAWGLDPGESEVLSFVWVNSGYRAIIDDAAARRVARTLSIPVLGTAGILLLAKQKGIIPSISDPIQALKNAGLWLSNDLVNFLKQQAGELPK
jgi:predicted nucleic acid-binding protein